MKTSYPFGFDPQQSHVVKSGAFTLIELLTVIAVIAVLAAILIPVTQNVMSSSRSVKCQSALRQIGIGMQMYASDHGGRIPWASHPEHPGRQWHGALFPYLGNSDNVELKWINAQAKGVVPVIWGCPEHEHAPGEEWKTGYGMNVLPLLPDDSTSLSSYSYSSEALPGLDGGSISISSIPELGDRIFAGDAINWHLFTDSRSTMSTISADLNRHGEDKANYVFFDGHVETLTEAQAAIAIRDPANR